MTTIYLLMLAGFGLFGIVELVAHFFFKKGEKIIVERVLIGIAIALFAVRYMCYNDIQVVGDWEAFQHLGGPQTKVNSLIGELLLWFIIPANLFVLMRAFIRDGASSWFVKFLSIPILVCCAIFYKQMLINMIGVCHTSLADMKLVEILLPIEIGAMFALSIYYLLKDIKYRAGKHEYVYIAVVATVGTLFSMPPFVPSFFFGQGVESKCPAGFNFQHRMLLYTLFIILPFLIYFFLRNKGEKKIRYSVIYISLAVMFSFVTFNKYDKFLEPWRWPWQLCNTAVFILPICFIFKTKRLYYFTYFINVFGAAVAMIIPDYEGNTPLDPDTIRFIMNHLVALWMPLVGVALKVFERPKFKQYVYSMIGFTAYFALILFLNAYFTANGHQTDFFFTNGTRITEKFGEIGKKVFANTATWNIKGKALLFRPLYQSIFYVGYIVIGLGMWFVYQLGFDISDSHYELHLRLKGIRQDHIALQSVLDGRSYEEPMDKDAGIKLEIEHFSKKYGTSKRYSAHDITFEVHAGEVFGFLGPNGAGKSTTIKSIVGIQPITEGKIRVCGYDVQSQPVQSKAKIGFVPDHYALYEKLTGREYINYIADIFGVSKEERDERIAKYVKLFELEASIDNKIKTYSHGMKQKITIISALVHNPKVWILDEPLTGLDPTSIFQVKQCIKKHAEEGNIVFFSSHLIDVVEKLCDRVAIIKQGELKMVDSIENIEKSGKTLEECYLNIIGDNVTEAGK